MGTMMNEMTRIAEEARVAVVVLHHNTEGRGKARGSTTITASADVVIFVDAGRIVNRVNAELGKAVHSAPRRRSPFQKVA